jgi:hypothetical protein
MQILQYSPSHQETTKLVNLMMQMVRDHRSSLLAKHAAIMSLVALAVVAVGLLMGFGAVDLYETANGWVLQA